MTLDALHEATRQALLDFERRLRELRDQAHIDRASQQADIDSLLARVAALEAEAA